MFLAPLDIFLTLHLPAKFHQSCWAVFAAVSINGQMCACYCIYYGLCSRGCFACYSMPRERLGIFQIMFRF